MFNFGTCDDKCIWVNITMVPKFSRIRQFVLFMLNQLVIEISKMNKIHLLRRLNEAKTLVQLRFFHPFRDVGYLILLHQMFIKEFEKCVPTYLEIESHPQNENSETRTVLLEYFYYEMQPVDQVFSNNGSYTVTESENQDFVEPKTNSAAKDF